MKAHVWEHRRAHTYESNRRKTDPKTYAGPCRTPIPGTAFCARLRSRNAHGHFTRAILCGNLQENAGPQSQARHFVRNAHGHFTRAIFCCYLQGKNTAHYSAHLDWTPGLNSYRKNPLVSPHCLGKYIPIFLMSCQKKALIPWYLQRFVAAHCGVHCMRTGKKRAVCNSASGGVGTLDIIAPCKTHSF